MIRDTETIYLTPSLTLHYSNLEEAARGGPWNGLLDINGVRLKTRYLFTRPLISQDGEKLLLGRFHDRDEGPDRNRWRIFGYNIIVIDLSSKITYESLDRYRALYFKSMADNILTFYAATHDQLEEYKRSIEFNNENFLHLGIYGIDV